MRFEREWTSLRAYAAARGIRILGDLPIYVAPGSADTVAHPALFDLASVAGAPPDYFTPEGQLWGNPLYNWPANRANGYRWWIERFRRTFELVDLAARRPLPRLRLRLGDPGRSPTAPAATGGADPAPSSSARSRAELGALPIVVEDLGAITPPVYRLRDELGLPGNARPPVRLRRRDARTRTHSRTTPRTRVVYTGTHDHDPLAAWWDAAGAPLRRRAAARSSRPGSTEPEPWWALIRLALSSTAELAIVQMQDVLGLGAEARLNTPGTTSGNWRWRLEPGQLTGALAARLREATEASGRLGPLS